MPTRRIVLFGGLLSTLTGTAALPVIAAEQTAREFLDRIYKTYVGKDAAGMRIDKPATMRVFTPALRKLIAADAAQAKKRDEVGKLDGDPFIDAQDWEIRTFAIEVSDPVRGRVNAKVRFRNFDKDVAMSLELVKLSDGWHIDEIVGPSGSLRALLKQQ